jgi:hypothetical protein
VARNGKVHVPGMVWGDDIIIQNERLVDTNNAIALAYSEVNKSYVKINFDCLMYLYLIMHLIKYVCSHTTYLALFLSLS